MDAEGLKAEIIVRMRQFNSRLYLHERISSTRHVVVVKRGALPRTSTKGNIQRRAVEGKYKELLDDIYTTAPKPQTLCSGPGLGHIASRY